MESVMTISWSEISGAFPDVIISDGLFVKDLDNMRLSLDKLTNGKPKHVIIAGDFNCPDIDWANMEIKTGASDREVQLSARSNMFPYLVGLSCIWVSPYSDVMSNSACCTSRSRAPVLISIFKFGLIWSTAFCDEFEFRLLPHRNMKDLDNLRLSLDKLTNGKPKHVIITRDFNCPDIDWVNMKVQQALLDIFS
jgi:hypothetical protein